MIIRIYTGEDGQSHFEDLDTEHGARAFFEVQAANSCELRFYEPEKFQDWHRAPRRQYVVTLSGHAKVQIGDGTSLALGPGDVILADDLTGRGHTTGTEGDEPWVYLTIQLP